MFPILIEMKYLPLCMHSRIRPACTHRFYWMMKDFLKGGIYMILHRFAIGLLLPSCKFGTIISTVTAPSLNHVRQFKLPSLR
jgi:hypothetical protein